MFMFRFITSLNFLFFKSTFKITDELDGSALSYTLTYADSNSDIVCGSATIPASSCNFGTCRYTFDANSMLCPASNIYNNTISVYATNLIGNGYTSSIVATISECMMYTP